MPAPSNPRRDATNLARQLVRTRSRTQAAQVLKERDPDAFGVALQAHAEGSKLFAIAPERYLDTTMRLVGRAWLRLLKSTEPAEGVESDGAATPSFADAVAHLDQGTFLRDLCSLCQGLEDPAEGATAFYRAFPGFAHSVDDWHKLARESLPKIGRVQKPRFRRKCYGAALYHLLDPLRASTRGAPEIARSFGSDPSAVLHSVVDEKLFCDLYYSVALSQANEGAIEHFTQSYHPVIETFLSKHRIGLKERETVLDDITAECILNACNYFASGAFAGWLWYQCKTFVRRWAPQGPNSKLSTLSEEEESTDNVELDGAEASAIVARAWDRLKDAEAYLIRAYFGERKTLKEIALTLRVHESTVLRRRDQCERTLRGYLLEEVRQSLGESASTDECLQFLMKHSRFVDFGFELLNSSPEPESDDVEPIEYCPLVPCKLP